MDPAACPEGEQPPDAGDRYCLAPFPIAQGLVCAATAFRAKEESLQRSGTLLRVVPSNRLVSVDRVARLPTGAGAPVTSENCPFSALEVGGSSAASRCPVSRYCPGTTTDDGEAVCGRPEPSADLLRQLDDDPLRAADVT